MSQKTESTSPNPQPIERDPLTHEPIAPYAKVTPVGPKRGSPSKCHPTKPSVAKGMCSGCYLRQYRANLTKPLGSRVINYVEVAALAGITPVQAKKVAHAMAKVMSEAIKRDETIKVEGFGRFVPYIKAQTKMGNPAWGGTVTVPARRWVKFWPSLQVRYMLNPHEYGE